MTRRKTPGKILVATLNGALIDDDEWTEQELVLLGFIESVTDRIELLTELFATLMAAEEPSTRKISEVGAELRQCEANVAKWVASLRPDSSSVDARKAPQQQAAANTRWHGGKAKAQELTLVQ